MTETTVKATFDIYRFEPGRDAKPRYQRFVLDLPPHTPVLTALLKIRDGSDPSLTLRYSCRGAICGSCAMQINSKSRLACSPDSSPTAAESTEMSASGIEPKFATGRPWSPICMHLS